MTEAGTRFAVLQRTLETPDVENVEKLKRAFRSVNGLTETDAHTLANDGFGILVNDLSPDAVADGEHAAAEPLRATTRRNTIPAASPCGGRRGCGNASAARIRRHRGRC